MGNNVDFLPGGCNIYRGLKDFKLRREMISLKDDVAAVIQWTSSLVSVVHYYFPTCLGRILFCIQLCHYY